jgi:hypothetical protein
MYVTQQILESPSDQKQKKKNVFTQKHHKNKLKIYDLCESIFPLNFKIIMLIIMVFLFFKMKQNR